MSAPALALAYSEKQRAAWERRRLWEEHEEELAELRAACVSPAGLRRMREKRGRGIKVVDLAELDGLRFDGAKAARPFLEVFAGVLLHSSARGLAGGHQAIALMLGAFGAPVGETCVRRALDSLEEQQIIRTRHFFMRHPKDHPFISRKDKRRPARTVTERGRIITAGPVLELAIAHLRAGAVRRKKQGCSEKTTHSDPLSSREVKNTYYTRTREAQRTAAGQSADRATPGSVSPPTASTEINTAPSVPTEKAALEGSGASSPRPARPVAVAPTLAVVASLASRGATPTPPKPSEPQASPLRRVWTTPTAEQQLADWCRANRRKRADVTAEAIAAYTSGAIAPRPTLRPVPQVAPIEPAPVEVVQASLAIMRAHLAPADVARYTARVEAGEAAQVIAELAARRPELAPRALTNSQPDELQPGELAPARSAALPSKNGNAAPVDSLTDEAAEACRAWLADFARDVDPPAAAAPARVGRMDRDDPDLLVGAGRNGRQVALGDWQPSGLGDALGGALSSLRRKVRDE